MTNKATWKGEEATPDLQETERFGIKFKKGEAVEVSNPVQFAKLQNNTNFTCDPPEPEPEPEPVVSEGLTPAPSEVSAQRPAPKGGEPTTTEIYPPLKPIPPGGKPLRKV